MEAFLSPCKCRVRKEDRERLVLDLSVNILALKDIHSRGHLFIFWKWQRIWISII